MNRRQLKVVSAPPTERAKALIEKYQCPGCVCGSDVDCGHYKQDAMNDSCENHSLGTSILGIGRVVLGMPKGFNREGPTSGALRVRIFAESSPPGYDAFNVAVWAMRHEGDVLVRTYLPRTNRTFVDVLPDTQELPAGAIDVGAFNDRID